MDRNHRFATLLAVGLLIASTTHPLVQGAAAGSPPTFTITPLLLADGSNEPEISIGRDGTMAMVALQHHLCCGTYLWTGAFGSIPTVQGIVDNTLQQPSKTIVGSLDADVDIGSTGMLHMTTLVALINAGFHAAQYGVSAITCPSPASSTFSLTQCTPQVIDTAGADRPWITSDGPHVYVSYHDAGRSAAVHMQRSDDDGFSWKRVGDPIVGQGNLTADATYNNLAGNSVADSYTHNVYSIYVAGVPGVLKAHAFVPNNVIVSRSTDQGRNWTANLVFAAPPGNSLAFTFPALGVDPMNGNLYAVWSDGQSVYFANSADQGNHWTPAIKVNRAPAVTAVFPWVAAYNGTVDVTYYGTAAGSQDDPSAEWHVYFAQLNAGSFTQTQVNPAPNHYGFLDRLLLDDFQVAINPQNGKAAIIYADDTLTTYSCPWNDPPVCPLPQSVLAQQN
jgi:hypothetical protein